ncbi:hypothetical protein C8J57DRAFT_1515515 [Mycena rebaudengoi]|nr:hypothetical protein C8J57DRAFT_1515515 [Mycena rebaudengoi]
MAPTVNHHAAVRSSTSISRKFQISGTKKNSFGRSTRTSETLTTEQLRKAKTQKLVDEEERRGKLSTAKRRAEEILRDRAAADVYDPDDTNGGEGWEDNVACG